MGGITDDNLLDFIDHELHTIVAAVEFTDDTDDSIIVERCPEFVVGLGEGHKLDARGQVFEVADEHGVALFGGDGFGATKHACKD